MNNVTSISEIIKDVESKWLKLLLSFNKQLFASTYIPSHDHTHHSRVWQNAKELICSLSNYNVEINYTFVEKVIIACLFHDTGLTVTLDEKHGAASRRICEDFFSEQNQPINFNEILNAIEFHEDKKYIKNSTSKNSIYSILAASDDIDAFGYIGVYRFAEIYLMRNIKIDEIGKKVLFNLENRFKNIENIYGNIKPFFSLTKVKYGIVHEFYTSLKNSNKNCIEILQIIENELIIGKKDCFLVWEYYSNSKKENIKYFADSILNEYEQQNIEL